MKFQTLSVLAGTKACDAACPFCVSRMTGLKKAERPTSINKRNLLKTLQLANMGMVSTAIITGKGEPCLYPNQISEYLAVFNEHCMFPFIELQTNGMRIACGELDKELKLWYAGGLTTIMVSNVGYDKALNASVYCKGKQKYFDMQKLVDKLHNLGFLVRSTCIGIGEDKGVKDVATFQKYLRYCKRLGIDQITWRPVTAAEHSEDQEVPNWISKRVVSPYSVREVRNWVQNKGVLIRKLSHGGAVYDLDGQNICMTDCLTIDPNEEELRQLIFFPNGELYTDWQFKGSRLL